VVIGKEVFRSGGQIAAGANLKILEDEILKLKYDNKGDFQLEGRVLQPKMFMVAFFPRQSRSSPDVLRRALTADELRRLESLRLK
jgi:hypothetical protein